MPKGSLPILITFVLYALGIFMVAIWMFKRTKNLSDYMLAGRNLSGPITALSAGASDMSSWLLMALPGAAYLNGLSVIWLPVSLVLGAYFNWVFVAPRLRVYTELVDNALTLPMYLSNRFQDKSEVIKIITAIAILIFFTCYAVTGLVAGAELIKLIFQLEYTISLFIITIVIVAYTAVGGFLAISWIDFFQGSLMLFSLIVVPCFTFSCLDNNDFLIQQLQVQNINYFDLLAGVKALGIISLMGWGLGYVGQPHILVRFMAIRSHTELPVARNICTIWMILSLAGAVLTGILGAAFYLLEPLHNPETVFLALARTLFNPWIAGILLSAVLSAIMSTVSALLLISTSALVEDILHRLIIKNLPKNKLNYVVISRIAMFLIAGVALVLASTPNTSILSSVAFAWSGLGASFGPVIIFSLYWRRITGIAPVFGIAVGASAVILWDLIANVKVELFNNLGVLPGLEIIPGFILSSLTIIVVSLNSKPPTSKTLQEFEQMLSICHD